MADTDTQQEPARVGLVDAVEHFATASAAAVQMLTMPVATCNVVVASRMGSTQASSAGGEPPPRRPVAQRLDLFGLLGRHAPPERSEPA